jgi:uncharacterized tellurite resistance protein B-like protein
MKNIEFRKILFKGAFSVMACDGEVAESEVAEMKEMLGNSPYFDGLDHEVELKLAFADIKQNGLKSIQTFFQTLETSDFSERQELQMVEVLIRMVQADNKVDDNELIFMHNIKSRLKKLSDEKIIVHFPRHIDLLLELGKFSSKSLQGNLETINLNAFGNLNVSN